MQMTRRRPTSTDKNYEFRVLTPLGRFTISHRKTLGVAPRPGINLHLVMYHRLECDQPDRACGLKSGRRRGTQ